MTTSKTPHIVSGLFIIILACSDGSAAHAAGGSVQVTSISPMGAINPGSSVSFQAVAAGFTDPVYSVTDPFSVAGATVGIIDKIGYFTWTPGVYDAGRHTITVAVSDIYGHSATTMANLVVASTAVIISSLTPNSTIVMHNPVTFTATAPGFTTPSYALYDATAMSSISSSNINSSGAFSWTPTSDDIGTHALLVRASDLYGNNAQATVNISVIAATSTGATATSTASTSTTQASAPVPTSTSTGVAAPATSFTSATKGYAFTMYLAIGSRGTAVTELQKRLIALEYLSSSPTGYFGTMTTASVKKFQKAHGFLQTGALGPLTRAALNK